MTYGLQVFQRARGSGPDQTAKEGPRTLFIDNKRVVVTITFRFLSVTSEHYNRITIPRRISYRLSEGGTVEGANDIPFVARIPCSVSQLSQFIAQDAQVVPLLVEITSLLDL